MILASKTRGRDLCRSRPWSNTWSSSLKWSSPRNHYPCRHHHYDIRGKFKSRPSMKTSDLEVFVISNLRLVGFLTSSSTTKLYRGRAPRQSVWQFYVLPHMRQSWETKASVSAGHIISNLRIKRQVYRRYIWSLWIMNSMGVFLGPELI